MLIIFWSIHVSFFFFFFFDRLMFMSAVSFSFMVQQKLGCNHSLIEYPNLLSCKRSRPWLVLLHAVKFLDYGYPHNPKRFYFSKDCQRRLVIFSYTSSVSSSSFTSSSWFLTMMTVMMIAGMVMCESFIRVRFVKSWFCWDLD